MGAFLAIGHEAALAAVSKQTFPHPLGPDVGGFPVRLVVGSVACLLGFAVPVFLGHSVVCLALPAPPLLALLYRMLCNLVEDSPGTLPRDFSS